MAAITRRRRFLYIFTFLCMSCALFAWYTRTDYILGLNEDPITEHIIEGNRVEYKNGQEHKHLTFIKKLGSSETRKSILQESRFISESYSSGNTLKSHVSSYKQPVETGSFSLVEEMKSEAPTTGRPVTDLESTGPPEAASTAKLIRTTTTLPPSGPTLDDLESTAPPSLKVVTTKRLKEIGFTTPTSHQVTVHESKPGLLLDTPGCKIPKLNEWDETVKKLYVKQDPLDCPGPPSFMKSRPDGSIFLNETVLETFWDIKADNLNCTYQSYQRKHEDPGNVRENDYIIGTEVPMKFNVPLEEDYVAVRCPIKNTTYEQYFGLVRLKKEVEESRSQITTPTPHLNVILAGIDSISKLNYLRHFTRTNKFLKEKMTPFEMKGYNKVGDNTFPNLVPLLTGRFVEHYWNETVRDTFYFDSIDLIWKDYAKKGYRTFYAEDSPLTGTFNYIKRGFYDPPTDYYFRPIALALEHSKVRKTSKSHCLNSQIETDMIYDYLRDFISGMGTRPHIAFAMVSTITHDYLNNAGLQDEPTVRLLEDLWDSGALNNSALFMFSDHGLRFGKIRETYIGKFEERMPFMFIHFPKWFLEQYPEMARNLHTNQERLMTLFDVHATMMNLLDLSRPVTPDEEAKYTKGSSLLNEISPNRTCEEANILPHWCPCQTFEVVPFDDPAAVNSSLAVVNDINKKLEQFSDKCAVLEIEKVLDVRLGQANDLVLRFVRHDNVVIDRKVVLGDKIEPIGDYLVTLVTKPGHAVFEATVRHNPNHNTFDVLGISRINMYGNQSICIDSQKMKIFCYCK